tara:strand:+ start:380 stop:1087 length:708 start_codon:yes stop_codon:yes gene_type:complete
MNKLLPLALMAWVAIGSASAAQRKALKEVDVDQMTTDTQKTAKGASDQHMALTWWIPKEYWESVFSRDPTLGAAEKREMIRLLSTTSILAVVQADVTNFGAFKFYAKEEVEKNMRIVFTDPSGAKRRFAPIQTIDPELKVVLGIFKPILANAMGNMGQNMHFFVLNDRAGFSGRLMDPYRKGSISIDLAQRDKRLINATIPLPLNCLFIPRKCPNGKDAHISWKFCPWTGKRLEE